MVLFVAYPILPWIGVMAAGYGFGTFFRLDQEVRSRTFKRLGAALIGLFLLLRASNIYGDPLKWSWKATPLQTLFSFLNCQKYPPSLMYVLMTLGPAILLLAYLPRIRGPVVKPFLVFGRVPMFYYMLHIYMIHGLAAGLATWLYRDAPWMFAGLPNSFPGTETPPYWGYGLGIVYLIWFIVLLTLYPLCLWFSRLKERRRDAWLSYL